MRPFFTWMVLVSGGILVAGCGGDGAGGACRADGECPLHQKCEAGGCVTGCIGDGDCPGQVCSAHGRCVDAPASNPDLTALPDLALPLPDLADAPNDAAAQNPVCGDGHVDPGEDCDDGAANS